MSEGKHLQQSTMPCAPYPHIIICTSFISSTDCPVFIVLQCHLNDHWCRKVTSTDNLVIGGLLLPQASGKRQCLSATNTNQPTQTLTPHHFNAGPMFLGLTQGKTSTNRVAAHARHNDRL